MAYCPFKPLDSGNSLVSRSAFFLRHDLPSKSLAACHSGCWLSQTGYSSPLTPSFPVRFCPPCSVRAWWCRSPQKRVAGSRRNRKSEPWFPHVFFAVGGANLCVPPKSPSDLLCGDSLLSQLNHLRLSQAPLDPSSWWDGRPEDRLDGIWSGGTVCNTCRCCSRDPALPAPHFELAHAEAKRKTPKKVRFEARRRSM